MQKVASRGASVPGKGQDLDACYTIGAVGSFTAVDCLYSACFMRFSVITKVSLSMVMNKLKLSDKQTIRKSTEALCHRVEPFTPNQDNPNP